VGSIVALQTRGASEDASTAAERIIAKLEHRIGALERAGPAQWRLVDLQTDDVDEARRILEAALDMLDEPAWREVIDIG
jgi:hypothetical protein